MSSPKFEICRSPAIDTVTGKVTFDSIQIHSGLRIIIISVDTLKNLCQFLGKERGLNVVFLQKSSETLEKEV